VTDPLRVEATGGSVDEARSNALRALREFSPRLGADAVRFEVLSEGSRGLLGLGGEPARVVASATIAAPEPHEHGGTTDSAAVRLQRLVERVTEALGVECSVTVVEGDELITATCLGDDLGRLIGRHGQTLDAIQLLAGAALKSEETRREVVVDAGGYRERRRRRLEEVAYAAAASARAHGERVALEPMAPAERKLVHTYLAEVEGVTTSSEGVEPYRHVIVEPG
jgi:spoIIIJ-associated protein